MTHPDSLRGEVPADLAPERHNDAVTTAPRQHGAQDRTVLVLPVLSLLCFAGAVVLDLRTPYGDSGIEFAAEPGWIYALNGVVLAGLSLVILRRDPHQRFGWAMAWLGLFWALDGLAQAYVRVGLSDDRAFPAMTFALWFLLRFTSFLPVSIAVLLLIFPNGRFLPGRWGTAGKVSLAVMCLACLAVIVAPSDGRSEVQVPEGVDLDPASIPVPADTFADLLPVLAGLAVLAFVVTMASVVVRHRRSRGVERDQMRWLLWAVIVMALVLAAGTVFDVAWLELLMTFTLMVMPAGAMTVAIVQPDIVSIEDLFGRTLVYGVALGGDRGHRPGVPRRRHRAARRLPRPAPGRAPGPAAVRGALRPAATPPLDGRPPAPARRPRQPVRRGGRARLHARDRRTRDRDSSPPWPAPWRPRSGCLSSASRSTGAVASG